MKTLILALIEELRGIQDAIGDRGRNGQDPIPTSLFVYNPNTGNVDTLPAIQALIDAVPEDVPVP